MEEKAVRVNYQPLHLFCLAVGLTFCDCPKNFLQYLYLLNSGVSKQLFGSLHVESPFEVLYPYTPASAK